MNEKYKQNFIIAGRLAGEVRAYGKSLIVKGASYNDVINQVNAKIRELKALPAFPPQIALNNVAAHFLPRPGEDIIFSDEVVKLDVGVCYQGAIGDCAVTVDLSGKNQNLIDAAEAALLAAEKNIRVGITFGEIGKIIEQTINSFNLFPVKNLCGHGLGYYKIHTSPSVPNYNDGSKTQVKPGMTFAIEPFATNGRGFIEEQGEAAIFSFVRKQPLTNPSAVIKFVMDIIRSYNGLPFALHAFQNDTFSFEEIYKAILELRQAGVIDGYAPLVESKYSMVAQAENSVLVDTKGQVTITTRL